ncbi:MAG: 16S rRNA (cytidine(1402)-2'-O)-methyltransferase [Dokdonella sp.]|uniref:16S rRNA (cytidine(1402)-2'-O)-methyltransferase n=1 Tax=Dokdonella sp. TaxID=2291710 RepID=UPI0025C6D44D|nr:16S rRNA (cytidine(1402)-2'-O)-methyltransferase [Dokdonella sp.]MBX3701745.1 16S rRNA (cytidine(1402)-2'-O)-methyltransferase [Dokdonella sp.]MCW5578919.1 16S rRNA (cytidine(1402)-2'-O)-methyltransferase [Dokdonella sp.]
MSAQRGRLWVVATPIGNLGDFAPRAREVLAQVALVAAEDTRHSAPLLAQAGVHAPLMALHEHNEQAQAQRIVARLLAGDDVALISDAGTPLVSDPGYRLVRAARAAGCEVSPVPGPCAAIAALSVAGIASDRFVFEGFLPARPAARRERLQVLAGETRTLIVYESSHRIVETLADLRAIFGDEREAALARELTKRFETVIAAPLAQIHARVIADGDQQRGEFVLVVAGAQGGEEAALLAEGRRVFALLREELPPARAARLAAAISGAPRKALYADAV